VVLSLANKFSIQFPSRKRHLQVEVRFSELIKIRLLTPMKSKP